MDDGGHFPDRDSETESEAAALDKEYWIRRAGEVREGRVDVCD